MNAIRALMRSEVHAKPALQRSVRFFTEGRRCRRHPQPLRHPECLADGALGSKQKNAKDVGALRQSVQVRKKSGVIHAGSLGEDLFERATPINTEECEEVVLGIDPDRSGALAILQCVRSGSDQVLTVRAQVIDVPVHKVAVGKSSQSRARIDATQLAVLMKHLNFPLDRTVAYLEGGGVEFHFSSYSAFVQGLGVGVWEGMLSHAGIKWHKINSKSWKSLFGLVGSKKSGTVAVKETSVALAKKVFPDLESHLSPKGKHGRADALLIASYGHLIRMQEQQMTSSLKESFRESGITGLDSERLKLDLLTANELKLLLKREGLKVSGKKSELIERLLESHSKG